MLNRNATTSTKESTEISLTYACIYILNARAVLVD